jgi:hypothetical protein
MRGQTRNLWLAFCAVVLIISSTATRAVLHPDAAHPAASDKTWYFAVSGDSRNCGDVVMPAIAAGVKHDDAAFYWHLGDLRWIVGVDQDLNRVYKNQDKTISIDDYRKLAWDDFIQSQLNAFANMPFYLGIGNHELYPPKTRAEFVTVFTRWLDTEELRAQRLKDDPNDHLVKTYYHWIRDDVSFINMDNASKEEFDAAQILWFESILKRDTQDPAIRAIVVGMHEALPQSISSDHSMDMWPLGEQTGLQVYHDLLQAQNEGKKKIYILASHSHYFLDGTYQTDYWKNHGGVLPGWIIGTAGAERYPLPPAAKDAISSKTNVYGYMLATVNPPGSPPGTIRFEFKQIDEDQIPSDIVKKYSAPLVHECFVGNRRIEPFH